MTNKKQIETIKTRIKEQKAKRAEINGEINDFNDAMNQTVENFAIGEAEEKDIQQVKQIIKEKTEEMKEIDEFIEDLEKIHEKTFADYIPVLKRIKDKRKTEIQQEANEQVKRVREARDEFARELQKLNRIATKGVRVNTEYLNKVRSEGFEVNEYDYSRKVVTTPPVISGGYTSAEKSLGISEQQQKLIESQGILPNWIK